MLESILLVFVLILIFLVFVYSFTKGFPKESRIEFINKFKNYYRKDPKKVIIIAVLIVTILLLSLYKPDWLVLSPSGLRYP